MCLHTFSPGTWQLGNHRGSENWPNQCPEARQTWRLHAEKEKMALKRLAQGKGLIKQSNGYYFILWVGMFCLGEIEWLSNKWLGFQCMTISLDCLKN